MGLLIFGKTGQVARALRAQAGHRCMALDRAAADLGQPERCAEAIRRYAPDAVINAAAYTAVDQAETQEALATRINGAAPTAMAAACEAQGIPFYHISTDYVFAGTGERPWTPQDTPAPVNAYGRSKLAGERGVLRHCGTVLRTSWVFSDTGQNFLTTMQRLGETRASLGVVADQIGAPTPASAIAQALLTMCAQPDVGRGKLYHFAGAPEASWADFAREIFAAAGQPVDVKGIPTAQYPTPAARPLNSRLECRDIARDFGIPQPDWRAAVARLVKPHRLAA